MVRKHTASRKTSTKKTSVGQEIYKSPLIPEKYQNVFYIGMIFLAVFIFFGPAIFGNGFYVSDNLASQSFKTYVDQANKDGIFPQWMPYIFSGMPSFAAMLTSGSRIWAFLQEFIFGIVGFIGLLFSSDVARLAFYYVIYGTGIYILMRTKDHERFVAFFTSLAAIFSTAVIVWIMIGHNTKPVVFAMFPYIILLMEKLREKFSLLYLALLIIAVDIMMEAGHLQLIFYSIVTFALYLIFEFISRLIKKQEPMKVLRSALLLALAGGIAFLMTSDRYLSTMEYTHYSTRGSAPIVQEKNNNQDDTGGNDYNYATMWSYSPGEMMLFLVPNYFGFGKLPYSGPATRGQEVKLTTYWGQKPFDDAAAYMGIGVLWLAILGFFLYRKNVFVQFLMFISLFFLLLSFGKNLPILYDFFYYYVPSFNKFRAPSMALVIVQFAIPVLAGYGLTGIIKWRKSMTKEDNKKLNIYIFSSAAFLVFGFLFSILFKSSYIDAVTNTQNASFQSISRQLNDLPNWVYSSMISDWYVTGLIAVGFALMIYLFVKRKINKNIFFVSILALLIFDLWRVDYRPMDVSDKAPETAAFKRTDVIEFLKGDKSIFRIADLVRRDTPNELAYFSIENVNGYHSAKLRVYQDLMDVANLPQAQGSTSTLFNPFLWNLLNVKYILAPSKLYEGVQAVFQSQQTQTLIYYNAGMLPRAFFVNSAVVEKPINILHHLQKGDFNPLQIAYVEKALSEKIDTIQSEAKAKIIEKKNQYIKIEANATGNNLLFISEIYYPAAWHAFIDGKPTDIIKTNYAFRSVIVPKGKHIVELKYESAGFETGKTLSLVFNILVLLTLISAIFMEMRKKK